MKLVWARHGESEANVGEIFANQEIEKYPLTPRGRMQAEKLASELADQQFAGIIASPILRAWQTALIIGQILGLEPIRHDGLREVDVGDWDGLSYGGENAWRLQETIGTHEPWYKGLPLVRVANGENLPEVQERLIDVLSFIRQHFTDEDSLLLVSHGGLFQVALPLIAPGLSFKEKNELIGHCAIIEVEFPLTNTAL